MANTTYGLEIVGLFAKKDELEKAVADLLAAGFERSDLSLLSSHDSLEILERGGSTWQNTVAALVGEYKILGPLATSGGILLAGGPVAGAFAGVIRRRCQRLGSERSPGGGSGCPRSRRFCPRPRCRQCYSVGPCRG